MRSRQRLLCLRLDEIVDTLESPYAPKLRSGIGHDVRLEHRKDAVHPSVSFVAGCERQGSQPCTALEWLQGMVSFGGLDHPPVVAAKGEQNLGAVVRRQHSVEIWQCNAVGAPTGMVGPAKIAGQPGSTHVPTALGKTQCHRSRRTQLCRSPCFR